MDRMRTHKMVTGGILLLTLILLLGAGAVSGTFAWLVAVSEKKVNSFEKAMVTSEVVETFDGDTKTNVKIKNTGNIDAYLRAALVLNWVDAEGNLAAAAPEPGTEVSVRQSLEPAGWFYDSASGYYYYSGKVAPTAETAVLFPEIAPRTEKRSWDGKLLHLEAMVLGSAIQADPADAVEHAWPVTVTASGTIQLKK